MAVMHNVPGRHAQSHAECVHNSAGTHAQRPAVSMHFHSGVRSIGSDYQGLIEFVSLGNGDCIMCNEEGKLIGLEGNRRLGNDILVGVFYIMSENEDGELLSLTERKIKHYTNIFWEPETFDRTDIEASAFFRLI